MEKRPVDLVVLSDVHLGTYGCHAGELLRYLRTIEPGMVVLNGDIIDMWQFSKRYFPAAHMQVVRHLLGWAAREVPVYYLPGNHDELLRRFPDFQLGSLHLVNKLSLKLDGEAVWIFHGDVFDIVMQHSRWLARLGAVGYDLLILINRAANRLSEALGGGKLSLSRRVKNGVKSAIRFVGRFEETVCDLAAANGYHTVLCGHIHQPRMHTVHTAHGPVTYLNSGDWIENLTALEYHQRSWRLYRYAEDPVAQAVNLPGEKKKQKKQNREILTALLREMQEPFSPAQPPATPAP